MSIHRNTEFKTSFWEWFDSLPLQEKKRFWYYANDAAEVYYYNKYWKHHEGSNLQQS